MKKYFLLFLMAGLVSLSACSSDDDAETTPETDPIVGTWVFAETNVPGLDPDGCENESTITFEDDNTANSTFYLPEDCEAENNQGNWTRTSANTYEIELPVLGSQQGTVSFENSNNTFVFTTSGFNFTFNKQ